MSNQFKGIFDKLEQQANINPDEVYKIAEAVKSADFSDERTVRQLVQRLSKVANKPVSKEKEEKIIEAITKNNVPMDMQSLNSMFK